MNELGLQRRRPNSFSAKQALALASGLTGAARQAFNTSFSPSARSLVNTAVKMAREPKNIDYYGTANFTNNNTGVPLILNATSQGSGGTNRTGRRFKMESLRLRLLVATNPAVTTGDIVRVMVVHDREARGAAPTTAQLLERTTFGVDLCTSPVNFDNTERFQYLYDKVIALEPQPAASFTTYTSIPIDMKLGQTVRCYNTSVGTVADIDEGSLYLILWAIQTTNSPFYVVNSRVTFRDL